MSQELKVNENSVITCCAKCMPPKGLSGPLHRLEFEGTRLMCQNPDCRHDWTDWGKQTKESQ